MTLLGQPLTLRGLTPCLSVDLDWRVMAPVVADVLGPPLVGPLYPPVPGLLQSGVPLGVGLGSQCSVDQSF